MSGVCIPYGVVRNTTQPVEADHRTQCDGSLLLLSHLEIIRRCEMRDARWWWHIICHLAPDIMQPVAIERDKIGHSKYIPPQARRGGGGGPATEAFLLLLLLPPPVTASWPRCLFHHCAFLISGQTSGMRHTFSCVCVCVCIFFLPLVRLWAAALQLQTPHNVSDLQRKSTSPLTFDFRLS